VFCHASPWRQYFVYKTSFGMLLLACICLGEAVEFLFRWFQCVLTWWGWKYVLMFHIIKWQNYVFYTLASALLNFFTLLKLQWQVCDRSQSAGYNYPQQFLQCAMSASQNIFFYPFLFVFLTVYPNACYLALYQNENSWQPNFVATKPKAKTDFFTLAFFCFIKYIIALTEQINWLVPL